MTIKIFYKNLLLVFVEFLLLKPSLSQVSEIPLPRKSFHYHSDNRLKNSSANDTLVLPFFDDFTSENDSLWLSNSPVFRNNNFPISPPDYGVATFDGLGRNGLAYDFSTKDSHGKADSLLSRPVNLNYSAGDSCYFSFWWQAGGKGDPPDSEDSLSLFFLDSTSKWVVIWSRKAKPLADFHQEIISIINPGFLHKAFQFKFVSVGTLSGQHDLWNIDYVYLNKSRTQSDTLYKDVGFVSAPPKLFKKYHSIPLKHFRNQNGLLEDSLYFYYRNLNTFKDSVKVHLLCQTFPPKDTLEYKTSILKMVDSLKNDSLSLPLSSFTITDSLKEFSIISKAFIDKRDNNSLNDTVTGTTFLSNYYAFDDGSAESAWGLNKDGAQRAMRFFSPVKDTLLSINICFPQVEEDISGRNIALTVWKSIAKGNDSIMYKRLIRIGDYADTLYEFKKYLLDSTIIVSDTFYIGFSQSSDKVLYHGLDKNSDARGNMFYQLYTSWDTVTDKKGAWMIRPVFGKQASTGIYTKSSAFSAIRLYPIPANDRLYLYPSPAIVIISDITGKEIISFNHPVNEIPVSFLKNGIYLIAMKLREQYYFSKIIIQH